MSFNDLIARYAAGADLLHVAIAGMSSDQLDAVPIAGQWSTRQVVCHIADFEIVYADRLKRVIAEHEPTFFGGDPDTFATGLAYGVRDAEEELQVIASIRRQLVRILKSIDTKEFQRIGHHNESGPLTLERLLQGITAHLPHHIGFIEKKRSSL